MKKDFIIVVTFFLFNAILLFVLLGFEPPYKQELALLGLLFNGMYMGYFLGTILKNYR